MIKEVKVISYNGKTIKIFINRNRLIIDFGETTQILKDFVSGFDVAYHNHIAWIAFLDSEYRIKMIELNLKKEEVRIKSKIIVESGTYASEINNLRVVVKDNAQVNVFFIGRKSIHSQLEVFHYTTGISAEISNITTINSNWYSNPYSISLMKDKSYIVICKNNSISEYLIYDIILRKVVFVFKEKNVNNVAILEWDKKLIIIYNKLIDRDYSLRYKPIYSKGQTLNCGDEEIFNLPKNIFRYEISVMKNKIFISRNNNSRIQVYYSDNLINWNSKYIQVSDDKIIKYEIANIYDGDIIHYKTYLSNKWLKRKVKNKVKDNNLTESLLFNEEYIKGQGATEAIITVDEVCYKLKSEINCLSDERNVLDGNEEKSSVISRLELEKSSELNKVEILKRKIIQLNNEMVEIKEENSKLKIVINTLEKKSIYLLIKSIFKIQKTKG